MNSLSPCNAKFVIISSEELPVGEPEGRNTQAHSEQPKPRKPISSIHTSMRGSRSPEFACDTSPPYLREESKPDLLTVAAIAIVATVIAGFIHEGLGHGGMCMATGGSR